MTLSKTGDEHLTVDTTDVHLETLNTAEWLEASPVRFLLHAYETYRPLVIDCLNNRTKQVLFCNKLKALVIKRKVTS